MAGTETILDGMTDALLKQTVLPNTGYHWICY
jgi:hypothetical protein